MGITAMVRTVRSVASFRRIELDPVTRRLRRAADVDDLRRIARRRLPRGVFDYIDGGAEGERTMRANSDDFAATTFVPRVLTGAGAPDISTTVLGRRIAAPLIAAPTGFTRIAHSSGEVAVARACARAGIPFTLSTLGTRSVEEVRAASAGTLWLQVYMWRDRGLVRDLLARAAEAGYAAILPTVDTAVFGRRDRDVRRGFTLPPKLGLSTLIDGALHPAWTLDFVRAEPIRFANVLGATVGDGTEAVTLADYVNSQMDDALGWRDIEWLRGQWSGPVVVKGLAAGADAATAASIGVDGVVVSNHGGRQLDGVQSTLALLPGVVDAVAGRCEVFLDGGVRRGTDIVTALALGAQAVLVGRPMLYGLGAAGERGVDHTIELLLSGLRRSLALLGVHDIEGLDPSLVIPPWARPV